MASLCPQSAGSLTSNNYDEITWAQAYRTKKKEDKENRTLPTRKLSLDESCQYQKQLLRKTCPKKKKKKKRKEAKKPVVKLDFLARCALSTKKYFDMLATPTRIRKKCKPEGEEVRQKCPKKLPCELGPCPPRIALMAVPTKRKLFDLWQCYHDVLAPERILKIDDMLHTEQNVEPDQAHVHFETLDRKRRLERRRKRRRKLLAQRKAKKLEKKWLLEQVDTIVDVLIGYVKDEPLFDLNYKQLLFSDGILDRLVKTKQLEKVKRDSKNVCQQTIVEISDKMAVWVDALMQFVENLYVESDTDIPARAAVEEEPESEEELMVEEEEVEMEEEVEEEQEFEEEEQEEEMEEVIIEDFSFTMGEEDQLPESGFSFTHITDAILDGLEDALARLIRIYDNCTSIDLTGSVYDDRYPSLTYANVLQMVKDLQGRTLEANLPEDRDEAFENLLDKWASACDKAAYTDDIQDIIPVVAALIAQMVAQAQQMPDDTQLDAGKYNEDFEGMPTDDEMYQQAAESSVEDVLLSEIPEERSSELEAEAEVSVVISEELLGLGEEEFLAEEELQKEPDKEEPVDVLYEKCQIQGDIKAHKPPRVVDHVPGTICCLSLKIWSVWLLEITHNAHNWTKLMSDVTRKVREFAAIVRGDVLDEDGNPKRLYKADWRKFCRDNRKSIQKWYEYSKHVKKLNEDIANEFRDKRVTCCPKCLQDNLIKDVVAAHDTFRALTEAMDKAAYWHCTLEEQVDEATLLADVEMSDGEEEEDVCVEPSLVDLLDLMRTAPCPESSSGSYVFEELVPEEEAEASTSKPKKAKEAKGKKKKKGKK